MDLSLRQANNAKNSLSKFLYERLFQDVVFLINTCLSNSTELNTKIKINMLDIAGFGKIIHK